MSTSREPSSPDDADDTPVRGAEPGESGYRRDDYWRKIDRDVGVGAGAPEDQPEPADDRPAPGHDADSPKETSGAD